MNQKECTLTNEVLVEKARWWIGRLCDTGGKAWSLRIPADFDHDPDLIMSELFHRFLALTAPQPEASDREIARKIHDAMDVPMGVRGWNEDAAAEVVASIRADERRKSADRCSKAIDDILPNCDITPEDANFIVAQTLNEELV